MSPNGDICINQAWRGVGCVTDLSQVPDDNGFPLLSTYRAVTYSVMIDMMTTYAASTIVHEILGCHGEWLGGG